jgi:hypothetical protein
LCQYPGASKSRERTHAQEKSTKHWQLPKSIYFDGLKNQGGTNRPVITRLSKISIAFLQHSRIHPAGALIAGIKSEKAS